MHPAEDHTDAAAPSAEEHSAVHAALTAVASAWRGGPPPTLNYLLAQWNGITAELEAEGYSDCAPEFHHDIWCRNTLAQVWPLLPPRIRTLRQPELDRIDDRYREATVPWPGRPQDEADWWHRRVPRRLEVEISEHREDDWPWGWEMMPFPRPDTVEIITWG
ncbi:hypothetical protein [Embleya sp. NBC_00896]|uniref:hypothetical protein n=1 Tax=Embleya sp. NBC_00896 TaxID=2975961 RepID=UPI002F913668|nr:hypothetical protein OG928_44410 [Embleya sp. NBC_00896]